MRQLKIAATFTDRNDLTLDKYLNDVSREGMITQEQEVELTQRIRTGDNAALDQMVRANLRFVISVAKQYQGQGMPLMDMISEGNVGLIKAAQKFDETRGFKFISYAVWWIRQSIMSGIAESARTVRLPLNQTNNIRKVRRATAELEQRFEREPTESELAECLEYSLENIRTTIESTPRGVSIDTPLRDSEDFSISDMLAGDALYDTDQLMMRQSLSQEVEQSLSKLHTIERNVVVKNFGIGTDELSLTAIADEMGLSKERVRQIRQRAIKQLAKHMRNDFDLQH